MEKHGYILSSSAGEGDIFIYTFQSVGPRGTIQKRVEFAQLRDEAGSFIPLFNLAFGDVDDSGSLRDDIVSNNGDMEKVLNTVAAAVEDFLIRNPDVNVYARGLTISRTLLYQRKLRQYYPLLEKDFVLLGQTGGIWALFETNINYDAFVIRKKR